MTILVQAFAPDTQGGQQPAVWLLAPDLASTIPVAGPVAEWTDASGNNRDGYQPFAGREPSFDPVASNKTTFAGGDYLFLDERGLDLSLFTCFLAFDLAAMSTDDQTVFSNRDLQLAVGGSGNAVQAHALRVTQNHREILGPLVETNTLTQLTLVGNPSTSFVTLQSQTLFVSQPAAGPLPAVFGTVGGRQLLAEADAGQTLLGGISEFLMYDEVLEVGHRSRNEDYQLSRWESLLVWDYRRETTPLALTGRSTRRNALNGGWGQDVLTGGGLSDTLRGGHAADLLIGGGGGDRFQIFPGHGDDVVVDFSEGDGDVIDLTPIFADQRGSPDGFLGVRFEITQDTNGFPRSTAFSN